MCGRIAQTEPSEYAQRVDALVTPEIEWRPSWNIGPMARVLGVRATGDSRRLDVYRWGLLPAWAKDPKSASRCFNARGETVATKPTFRHAFRRRRLLVPVDGFFEWQTVAGAGKQPYFFHRADGEPVVLAGLWELWEHEGETRQTLTVVTTEAGPDMPIHNRQPVILERGAWPQWLDPEFENREELVKMLTVGEGILDHHPVSQDVGSIRNNGAQLIDPTAVAAGFELL